jgi:hypothetical protein
VADFMVPDIAGAQARGRQNYLSEQAQKNDLALQPKRNVLLDLNIESKQQANQQNQTQFGQGQAVQKARLLGQVSDALMSIPLEQRQAAAQKIDQQYPQLNLNLSQVAPENFSDEGLAKLKAVSQAIGTDPSKAARMQTSGQRDREDLAKSIVGTPNPKTKKPFTLEEARQEVALRDSGLVAKSGTISKDERIATTDDLTDAVASSQATIKDRVKRAEENAKNATGQIKEYFDQLGNIERNIANFNEAIQLIDDGAETGAIASKLPSVKAASVKLDNVIGRLGLDVIGNTTFGALSEAELKFALDTAGPGKLDGPELRQWFVDKRDAQEKLSSYISNAIQFLNIPGNSLADLQAAAPRQNAQDAPKASGATNAKGWKLMTDVNNNKAYVSPDGKEFEEVK